MDLHIIFSFEDILSFLKVLKMISTHLIGGNNEFFSSFDCLDCVWGQRDIVLVRATTSAGRAQCKGREKYENELPFFLAVF